MVPSYFWAQFIPATTVFKQISVRQNLESVCSITLVLTSAKPPYE